jgi:DNA-binding winged helix-turn-helix (wHTH) protein
VIALFPPYRVDLDAERVWRAGKPVALRRKPFAILRYLVANPKRLVTHDEVLAHVWGGAIVSESAMRSHLYELRQVLGEGVIETVVGRGYRFVAELALVDEDDPGAGAGAGEALLGGAGQRMVGRAAELAVLAAALERATSGARQLCFVTGDPGMGKTTLVDAFVAGLGPRAALVLRGQCIEQYGTPEAYYAVIEMLGRLRANERGAPALAAFARYAPTFLAHVPHLAPDGGAVLARRAGAPSEGRLVRELLEGLEAMTAAQPVVIVIEDLQWSDVATLDLLALLGQRKDGGRLLLVGTSRRAEAQTATHPLSRVLRTLVTRGAATQVPLAPIEPDAIRSYVDRRFPGHAFPAALVDVVRRITGGTPLFLVSFLDDLVGRDMIAERGGAWSLLASLDDVAAHRPESVRQLIDIQLDRLAPAEQRALEAASVVGPEFSTGLVAAALDQPVLDVDELFDALARRALFVRPTDHDEWPDGSVHTRYRVTHALVQEVCFARASPARRQRWHRLVAERLEAAYGERAGEVAHVLAGHFEQGQVPGKAMQWYVVGGERSAQRYSNHDALRMYRRAYDLLQRQPESPEREALELEVLEGLSQSAVLSGDDSLHSPIEMYERIIVLARRRDDIAQLYAALVHLHFRLITLAEYARARALEPQIEALGANESLSPALRDYAEFARAVCQLYTGDIGAIARLQRLGRATTSLGLMGTLGWADRAALALAFVTSLELVHGLVDTALVTAQRVIAQAQRTGDPYTLGAGLCAVARMKLWRGEPSEVPELVARVHAIPDASTWHVQSALVGAAARATIAPLSEDERERLVATFRARTGPFRVGATLLGLSLVLALRASGDAARATMIVDDMLAFAARHGERIVESELLRQRGELVEASDPAAAAARYEEAIALARALDLRLSALRAATRLAVLWKDDADAGRRRRARELLEAALGAMTEGEGTGDLARARAALAALDIIGA